MAKMLKLSSIKPPALYIRTEKGPDLGHVADLGDVLDASDKAYPFHDPIVVRKLAKPEKVKLTMANKPGTAEYELLRGVHRCLALVSKKYTEASAEVIEAGDAEAFASQYDDAEQGTIKKHDLQERNFYIRTLRDNFGWTLVQIGDRMKITEASVSRILAGIQAGEKKPRKKRGKNKGKTSRQTEQTETTFAPSEFFALLDELVAAYNKNRENVLAFRGQVNPDIISGAETMMTDLLGNA